MDERCRNCDKRRFDDLVFCDYSEPVPETICEMLGREHGTGDGEGGEE